jgi:glycosyltransferase involved in cell wall biosynthesis
MRIVMLLHKSVEHDARVRREARALSEASHQVVVVHLPRPGEEPTTARNDPYELRAATPGRVGAALPGPLRRAVAALRMARVARRERPDVVHAHDAAMLAPGWLASRRGGALVYDSHELATGVPYRSRFWALLVAGVERLFVPGCEAVITVSEGIARRIQLRYRLERTPIVVRNVPDLPPPGPGVPDLRRELGSNSAPLVLHHGALAADRGCESLVRAMEQLPSAHLLLLGAEGPYAEQIRALVEGLALGSRVHFRPPAPLPELLSHTAQADVGVTLLEGVCENHRLALPNKVFEYVAAGIPVVASDLPELAALVREYGIGFTVDVADPASVADGIRRALEARSDPELLRSLATAGELLSWRRERERLIGVYAALGERRDDRALGE